MFGVIGICNRIGHELRVITKPARYWPGQEWAGYQCARCGEVFQATGGDGGEGGG